MTDRVETGWLLEVGGRHTRRQFLRWALVMMSIFSCARRDGGVAFGRPDAAGLLTQYVDAYWKKDVVRLGELTEPNVRQLIEQGRFTREDTVNMIEHVRKHPAREVRTGQLTAFIGWDWSIGHPVLRAVVVGEGRAIHAYAHLPQGDLANESADWQVAAIPDAAWSLGYIAETQRERDVQTQRLQGVSEEVLLRWFEHGEIEARDAIRQQVTPG